jgi:hypothetical protein
MVRTLRLGVLALVILGGCKKSQPAPPAALRFLPQAAEIAVRVDLARAKTWSGYAKAAPVAFRSIAVAVEAVKKACGLDLIADASSIVLARKGTGAAGDMTLVIAGLPGDKLTACPVKLGATIPPLEVVPDGDRFSVKLGGKGFASGAILPTGELVLVSRAAANVEPAAWREEVTGGTGSVPSWWAELDQVQPIAVRTQSPDHTITVDIQLGDPIVVRGKSVAASAQLASTDLARGKAILEFLTKADAGVGRLEPRDNVVHGDLTATGPQIDRLVSAALAAIGGDEPAQPPPVENTSPIECSEMAGAVKTYMAANLAAMDPAQRPSMEPMFAKLVPELEKAYVESCTTDKWPPGVIHCHVDHADQLPRFEKCRLLLDAAPRTHFDQLVTAALSSVK